MDPTEKTNTVVIKPKSREVVFGKAQPGPDTAILILSLVGRVAPSRADCASFVTDKENVARDGATRPTHHGDGKVRIANPDDSEVDCNIKLTQNVL